uniref:uncharacterized protein LOC778739 n=1 Tax=Ciona intestinalis TaxID=7719 RepID=UPI000180B94A|nr:uncharacterized protein LOC778739 [Ciona intestinalis]|eukprot:XP_026693718.1 uncharacterized protein LOC778739 [Ciona intestinalis]
MESINNENSSETQNNEKLIYNVDKVNNDCDATKHDCDVNERHCCGVGEDLSLGSIFVTSASKYQPISNDEDESHIQSKSVSSEKVYFELENYKPLWENVEYLQHEESTVDLFPDSDEMCSSPTFLQSISNETYLRTLAGTLATLDKEPCDELNPHTDQHSIFNFHKPIQDTDYQLQENEIDEQTFNSQKRKPRLTRKHRMKSRTRRRQQKMLDYKMEPKRASASVRERRRMLNINTAFESLRSKVPTFPYEKRLSKIDTLRLAIAYIALLREVLASGENPHEFVASCLEGRREMTGAWNTSDLITRLCWIKWD